MKKTISIAAALIILVLGFFGMSLLGSQPNKNTSPDSVQSGMDDGGSKFIRGVKRIVAPILGDSKDSEPVKNPQGTENVVDQDPDSGQKDGEVIWIGESKVLGGENIDKILPPSVVIDEIEESGVFESKDLAGYTPIQFEPDKYETTAKQQEGYVGLDFKDENGVIQLGVLNTLNLNEEDVLYVLSAYTNYYTNGQSLSSLAYNFEVDDYEGRYENVDEGTVLVSDDKIFVIMAESQTTLKSLLEKFNEQNETTGTFTDYLKSNPAFVSAVDSKLEEKQNSMEAADQKVPQAVKDFGGNLWDAFINLDTNNLSQYYADKVWFYADPDEWFSEKPDNASYTEKKFYSMDRAELLTAYKELKAEEFSEELSMMKSLKSELKFYYIEDLMQVCDGEDENDFYTYLNAQDGDIVMFAQRGTGNTDICTINGKFNFIEKNFWLLRQVNGSLRVVTDFNE